MSIRLEDEKASLMGDVDGTTQLPIAYEPMVKERLGCKSKGKCAARLAVRLTCTIIAICGIVFFMKHFSPLPKIFGQEANNPLRYYPGKDDQAAGLPIPTSIPTSLPKPPSPPKPPQPPHLPDHIPHHPPHLPHGPPLPVPIECLDISDAKASVNLSLTLDRPWSAIHLDHTLDQATINIQHEESSGPAEEHHSHKHPHGPPPPPHHPHGPPPPPPHHPHGHPPPGKSETVMVTVSRTAEKVRQTPLVTAESFDDEKKEKKEKKVYVCALKLPFAGTGLGLFHHKPAHKEPEGSPEEPVPPPPFVKEEEEPKDPHGPVESNFPAVSLAFRFPAGAPFNIKSGLPIRPPPFGKHGHHKGLPWWHHHDDKDQEKPSRSGFLIVVTKMVHRVGCAGRRMMAKGE